MHWCKSYNWNRSIILLQHSLSIHPDKKLQDETQNVERHQARCSLPKSYLCVSHFGRYKHVHMDKNKTTSLPTIILGGIAVNNWQLSGRWKFCSTCFEVLKNTLIWPVFLFLFVLFMFFLNKTFPKTRKRVHLLFLPHLEILGQWITGSEPTTAAGTICDPWNSRNIEMVHVTGNIFMTCIIMRSLVSILCFCSLLACNLLWQTDHMTVSAMLLLCYHILIAIQVLVIKTRIPNLS